jgi:hypothetical protein
MTDGKFVHVLLYKCPQCGSPMWATVPSSAANLEGIDAGEVSLKCKCRWTGTVLGLEAKRHVVMNPQKIGSAV